MRRAVMLCFATLRRMQCGAMRLHAVLHYVHARATCAGETQGAPVAPLIATNCLEYGPPIGLIAS